LTDRIKSKSDLLELCLPTHVEKDEEQLLSGSTTKRKTAEFTHRVERLADICWNLKIVYLSRLKVDSFDRLKARSEFLKSNEIKMRERRESNLCKKVVRALLTHRYSKMDKQKKM